MVLRFKVNGKALSSLTLEEIFSEIRKRDSTIKLSDEEDSDNEDENNIGNKFEKSLERLLLKFKNKKIKYEKEYSTKSQEKIKELQNENSKLKSELDLYSSINKITNINNNNNNNDNNNNNNNNNNNINNKNGKCLKLYRNLINEFKVNKILSPLLSITKDTEEFIKFMVIKVMENDLGDDNKLSDILLPSPSIHSYWKKMVLNSVSYKEFLRIIGKDIHFKLSDKINIDNKESLWPLDYLLPPGELELEPESESESKSESESESKSESKSESIISPPITSPPINIFSTCFSLPPQFGLSSSSSSSSSSPSSSNSSTPCSSPRIKSILRSRPKIETHETIDINIDIIIESNVETLYCRVPYNQMFYKILKSFMERNPTSKYYYKGKEIFKRDSPKSLKMENDDIIEAKEDQKEIV
ncbi:hypothetical protein ACTA71_000418 [Dictyostelium dimigraforme]